jgi:hypothetical protein
LANIQVDRIIASLPFGAQVLNLRMAIESQGLHAGKAVELQIENGALVVRPASHRQAGRPGG